MTITEAKDVLTIVAVVYPTPEWTKQVLEVYAQFLVRHCKTVERAREGVDHLLKKRTRTDRPTPAEIHNAICIAARHGFVY